MPKWSNVYAEHVLVCIVMNEGLSMYRIERNWNDAYVQGVLIFTHTLTPEWMNKAKLSQKGFGVNTLRQLRWSV